MEVKQIFEKLFKTYEALEVCRNDIWKAFEILVKCYQNNAKVLVCGNGGSAADSEHIVGELMKGFNKKRPLSNEEIDRFSNIEGGEEMAKKLQGALPAISLASQIGLITAFLNDVDAELIFAQQVYAYSSKSPDDVLIALSTSGNSANIYNAAVAAKAVSVKSIAITGENDSKLSKLADVCIKIPAATPFEVQEYTLPIYHALCAMLEAEFFKGI